MALPNLSFLFRSRDSDDSHDSRQGGRRRSARPLPKENFETYRENDDVSPLELSAADRRARDAAWVTRIRGNDADAFTEIYRAYFAVMVRFVRRYVETAGDAEDAAQETLIQLWERRATLDPERSLQALLLTSSRNRALNVIGRVRRLAKYANQLEGRDAFGDVSMAPPADEQFLADELTRFASRQIEHLPARQREIFYLSRNEGLSPAEIGEILGITTQTVYSQLSRIVKILYQALAAWTKNG